MIIVAVIAIVVLLVIIMIYSGNMSKFVNAIFGTEKNTYKCYCVSPDKPNNECTGNSGGTVQTAPIGCDNGGWADCIAPFMCSTKTTPT